jgi:hypothetical protein
MSCTSSKVLTDYDATTDFTKFKSFDFYEDTGEGLNEFDVKRISSAIQKELEIAGLKQNSKPDFFIYFDAIILENINNNTIGVGLGGGGRNGGFGISGAIPIGSKKINEEIRIRFIDTSKNQLFWEASLIASIKEKRTPEERKLHLREIIKKIIGKYPSGKN